MLYMVRRVKDKQIKADNKGRPLTFTLRQAQQLLTREYGQTGPRYGTYEMQDTPKGKKEVCISEPWFFEFIPA